MIVSKLRFRRHQILLKLRSERSLSEHERFIRDGHNNLLLANVDLGPQSVVMDFGGYIGEFTELVNRKHGSHIHVFEPVPDFAAKLRRRFSGSPNVVIHEMAIGEQDEMRSLSLSGEGTGLYAKGREVRVRFQGVETLTRLDLRRLDLVAINIEGGEFDLLPLLYKAGIIRAAKTVLIQFHQVGQDPWRRRQAICELLSETHVRQWNYDFVWERWQRRSIAADSKRLVRSDD